MRYALALCALLLTAPAAAQEPPVSRFTAQEQTELARIHTARVEIAAQLRNLSDAITHSQVEATRPLFYQTVLAGIEASYDCHLAIRYFFHSAPELDPFAAEPSFAGLSRSEVVARGIQAVADCQLDAADFAAKLIATGQAALAQPNTADPLSNNQANIIINGGIRLQNPQVISLSVFNGSHTYLNWQPRDYPNVIGPHGDYNFAQREVDHADLKMLEFLKDSTAFYGQAVNWNHKANVGYREGLAYGSDALGLLVRVWYINAGMVLRFPDQQAIAADVAFSTGLRPPSFFAILRSLELINSPDPHLTGLGGRLLAAGITGQFAVSLEQMGDMFTGFNEVNTQTEVTRVLNMSGGQTAFPGALSLNGRGREMFADFAQAWKNLDAVNAGLFLFFRPPQPPPSGCPAGQVCMVPPGPCPECPPPPVCEAGTVEFQSISPSGLVSAICVVP